MVCKRSFKRFILYFLFFLLAGSSLQAQTPLDTLVSRYVNQGLSNNLALSQKNTDYEKSLEALKQARSHFMPSLSFNARYTVANGGRTIDFPVGDLLNPVYQTLNLLTASSLFPTIENQSFNFYRPTEHETKLELIQPLFNPKIKYNYRINKELTGFQLAEMNAYKRQLVSDIKKAYYTYLKLVEVNKVLDETFLLVKENVRMNEKLFNNQKITSDILYRSKAELSKIERERTGMESKMSAARNWFNFLLNRPLSAVIQLPDTTSYEPVIFSREQDSLSALENREELLQLEYGLKSAEYRLKLEKGNRLPELFAVVDYGFQGEKYQFNMHQDFTLASVVLRWDLFKGLENRSKIKEAELDRQKLMARKSEIRQQILMQVNNARNEALTAGKAIQAAMDEETAAAKGFLAVEKRYRQEMVPYIEFLDALTTLTNARLQVIITTYDYLIALAEYERVTGTYLI